MALRGNLPRFLTAIPAGTGDIAASRHAGAPRRAREGHSPAPSSRQSRRGGGSRPVDFPALRLTPGVGARTVRALALVAEVVHGAPCRFTDPARFSLAHGGKDRHPFPVPIKVYDETIRVLKTAVQKAKLGQTEEIEALRRLDQQARRLEQAARGPSVEHLIAQERDQSHRYGGRSVFGFEEPPAAAASRKP